VGRNNAKRAIPARRATGPGSEGNSLKGEPHGRYRHETRPGVRARSKPSRGCETLRTERTRCWQAGVEWTRSGSSAVGATNSMRVAGLGLRAWSPAFGVFGSRSVWNQRRNAVRPAGHVGLHPEVGVTAREALRFQGSSERRSRSLSVDGRPKGATTRQLDFRVVEARIGITQADTVIHRRAAHL
jgi:hypothetical protein